MNTDRDHHNTSRLISTFGFKHFEPFLIRVHPCSSVCIRGRSPPTVMFAWHEPTQNKPPMNTDEHGSGN